MPFPRKLTKEQQEEFQSMGLFERQTKSQREERLIIEGNLRFEIKSEIGQFSQTSAQENISQDVFLNNLCQTSSQVLSVSKLKNGQMTL